jgi:hypothetical protein
VRSSSLALALGALALATSLAPTARANGRFPAAQVLLPAPGDPNLFVLRSTFGILFSKDQGANWDWVCEGAVGYDTNEDPPIAATQSGTILAGAFKGLFSTTDTGCTWAATTGGIADQVVDIDVVASNPHAAFLVTTSYLGADDAGSTFTSKVMSTADDGAHWAQVGTNLDPEVLPETIDVAPSDPLRVYLSGTRSIGGVAVGVFLASVDGGKTWAQTVLPMTPKVELAPYIAAVDPTDAKRAYVRFKATNGSRLAMTTDGGATFKDLWQSQGALVGFALSKDGSRVYAGGTIDGLNVASRSDLDAHTDGGAPPFTQTSKLQIQCLTTDGDVLWACSNEASGFIVGTTTDEGKTFTPKLHLCAVRGPLACPADSKVTTVCGPAWTGVNGVPGQADALGEPCVGADGGSSSSGGSSGGGSSSGGGNGANAGGSGCGLGSPANAGLTSIAAASLALAFAGLRRRRQR